jgi:basic membrane protein A
MFSCKLKAKTSTLCLMLLMALAVVLCGGQQANAEKYKVAFMSVGPIGDGGWNFAHHEGKKYIDKTMPDVEAVFLESIPETQDAERTMMQLAQQGNQIIFAASFGYMDYVIKTARRFPKVHFFDCAHFKVGKNYGVYYGRMYQPRYLSGLIAGKMTKNNKLGYVASHPIPEVIRGINAFALGVRAVNPKATIKVVWTNTWYDPAREKEAAKSLLDVGCDILAENQDTAAAMQAAQERGKYGIGNNSDMAHFAPKAVLTTPIFNWGKFYKLAIEKVRAGKFEEVKNFWGGLDSGVVDLAPYGPMVSEDIKKMVEAKKQDILAGKWDVFTGPIKDQAGKLMVAEGKRMSDADMARINWFVEGVQGTIK